MHFFKLIFERELASPVFGNVVQLMDIVLLVERTASIEGINVVNVTHMFGQAELVYTAHQCVL